MQMMWMGIGSRLLTSTLLCMHANVMVGTGWTPVSVALFLCEQSAYVNSEDAEK